MFEKEAKDYANGVERKASKEIVYLAFKDGAGFGYNKANEEMQAQGLALQSDMDKTIEQNIQLKKELNKANEWHYMKDKLPPSGESVLLYYGVDVMGKAVTSTGCVDCKGNWYKNVEKEPIQWKEIVLPKEIKEND